MSADHTEQQRCLHCGDELVPCLDSQAGKMMVSGKKCSGYLHAGGGHYCADRPQNVAEPVGHKGSATEPTPRENATVEAHMIQMNAALAHKEVKIPIELLSRLASVGLGNPRQVGRTTPCAAFPEGIVDESAKATCCCCQRSTQWVFELAGMSFCVACAEKGKENADGSSRGVDRGMGNNRPNQSTNDAGTPKGECEFKPMKINGWDERDHKLWSALGELPSYGRKDRTDHLVSLKEVEDLLRKHAEDRYAKEKTANKRTLLCKICGRTKRKHFGTGFYCYGSTFNNETRKRA